MDSDADFNWSSLPPMNTYRQGFASAVMDGKLFVVGGFYGKKRFSSCEVYDKQSKRWSSLPPMTTKRSHCAAAVMDGKLFVAGGYDGKKRLSSCEVYDEQSKRWSSLPSMPTKRSYCSGVVVDGKLIVAGGYDGKKWLSSCEVYDKQSKRWSTLPSMPTKRTGSAAAVADGKLIVAGGHDGTDRVSSCEVLPIAKHVSPFYTKLIQKDDRNIHLKITELIPIIEDVHQVKFIYTLIKSAYRLGYLEEDKYVQYIISALERAARSTMCTAAVVIFKLVLDKAEKDGIIDDSKKYELDREAEVTHTSNAPFVKDLWEHIHANTAWIQGLEMRVEGLEARTERLETRTERLEACFQDLHLCLVKLQKGIIFKHKVDAVTGMMSSVLNAISFGVLGSAASGAMQLAINKIVDFGDIPHMKQVVKKVRDVTVHDALDHALTVAERVGSQRLYQDAKEGKSILKGTMHAQLIAAANDGNPLMAVAITAHIVSNTEASPVANDENVTSYPPEKPKGIINCVQALEQELSLENVSVTIVIRVENLEVLIFDEIRGGFLGERIIALEEELECTKNRVQVLEQELCLENVPTAIIKRVENLEVNIYDEIHSGFLGRRITALEEQLKLN